MTYSNAPSALVRTEQQAAAEWRQGVGDGPPAGRSWLRGAEVAELKRASGSSASPRTRRRKVTGRSIMALQAMGADPASESVEEFRGVGEAQNDDS